MYGFFHISAVTVYSVPCFFGRNAGVPMPTAATMD
jgi:hypothetical protein